MPGSSSVPLQAYSTCKQKQDQCKHLIRAQDKKNLKEPVQYLDKEEFGFSHQWLAAITSIKGGQTLKRHRAVRTKEQVPISMTQQNADKRSRAAVILLRH